MIAEYSLKQVDNDLATKDDKTLISFKVLDKKKQEPSFEEIQKQVKALTEIKSEVDAPKIINPYEQDYSPVEKFLRGRFFQMMRELQYQGANAWVHYKKLYIFTGTWYEKIDTIDELYKEIQDITPGEAMIRTFNLLCPYDKELPRLIVSDDQGKIENAWRNFNGIKWYEDISEAYKNRKGQLESIEEINKYERQIQTMRQVMEAQVQEIEELGHQKDKLQDEVNRQTQEIRLLKDKILNLESTKEKLLGDLKLKNQEIKDNLAKFDKNLQEKNLQLDK